MNYQKYFDYLVSWLQEEVAKANMNGVIVGLSGGIDSALVATIAKKAFPNNSLGVIMPINDMGQDLEHINKLVEATKIENITVNLKQTFQVMENSIPIQDKLAVSNIKPRLRMTTLYALAQDRKYLVLGTDNRAEMFLGYFTKYGDGGVDLLPIVHLTKKQVREMSKLVGVPSEIIIKPPSAGLWEGQTDEDELGFKYDDFDQYVIDKSKLDPAIIAKIERQNKVTEHKRKPVPQPKKYEEII